MAGPTTRRPRTSTRTTTRTIPNAQRPMPNAHRPLVRPDIHLHRLPLWAFVGGRFHAVALFEALDYLDVGVAAQACSNGLWRQHVRRLAGLHTLRNDLDLRAVPGPLYAIVRQAE